MSRKFKIALCQMPLAMEKEKNVATALDYIADAKTGGADVIVLPEMFSCPYSNRYFRAFSEPAGGPTWQTLSAAAGEHGVYLVAGSIPEYDDDKIYNTCFIFGPDGSQLGRHRKIHLFDIDIKGRQTFKESLTLTPGEDLTFFDTPWGRLGVIICFDMRFSELAMTMSLGGAEMLIIPAAFNMTTGPMHWDLTLRARAVDNQIFTAACGPAHDEDFLYVAYGNSLVSDPWGNIISRAQHDADIVYADIDLDEVKSVREQLPILSSRKPDLYKK